MKLILIAIFMVGCTAEWDCPKVPQTNPYTGRIESQYVYIPARHQLAPIEVRRYGQ